jgi:pimeloyl-ACP methyl ester carboxylesterase
MTWRGDQLSRIAGSEELQIRGRGSDWYRHATRLAAIEQLVFVANGDGDPMIPPRYSHLLAGLLPHATVKIYPDAAHGFLFQHHAEFAADVTEFMG